MVMVFVTTINASIMNTKTMISSRWSLYQSTICCVHSISSRFGVDTYPLKPVYLVVPGITPTPLAPTMSLCQPMNTEDNAPLSHVILYLKPVVGLSMYHSQFLMSRLMPSSTSAKLPSPEMVSQLSNVLVSGNASVKNL